jgi:hypothetical protein
MSLKPFWQKHPTLLRLTAGLFIIAAPFVFTFCAAQAIWAERWEIVGVFKSLWGYVRKGGE